MNNYVKPECIGWCWTIGVVLVAFFSQETVALGLSPNPDRQQIERALKRGREFAQLHRPPNELYWQLGSEEKWEPTGYLVTKISGLAVMASHFALRGELPAEEDIQQVLKEESMQVVVTIFGDSPGFARESYVLLKQGERMVKPDRIRSDARAREAGFDQGIPRYKAKVVGFFPYAAFNPNLPGILLVFPGIGGEIRFDVNFSVIP